MSLNPNLILICASPITLNIRSPSDIRLRLEAGPAFRGNQHTLNILNIFASERSVQDGLDQLLRDDSSIAQFAELGSQIQKLYQVGFLVEPKQAATVASSKNRFDAPPVHIRMLNDEARTLAYQAAIRELVNKDDVVLDIGTGSGILAATAALVGAKKVFAVELTSIGLLAEEVFAANGLSDRVKMLRGHSTEIELPERADILVSEIIGNDPLSEGILSVTADAIERHLKPGARIIPSRLDIFAQPYAIPDGWLEKQVFTSSSVTKWKKLYGIEFGPLAAACADQSHASHINSFETRDWLKLSDPVLLKSIDFEKGKIPAANAVFSSNTAVALQDGAINGILVYFSAQLSPNIELNISPDLATPQNSWSSHIWIFGNAIPVSRGESFELLFRQTPHGSAFEVAVP